MTKSDLYIHGSNPQLEAIKRTVITIAHHAGCNTADESCMNIPLSLVMQVLVGDTSHPGLLIGMNAEDPQCVVLRVECNDIVDIYEAFLQCFAGTEIEVEEVFYED